KNYLRPGWLAPDDTLFYHLKLLSIQPKAEIEAEKLALEKRKAEVVQSTKALLLDYQSGKLDNQIKALESGLKYIIHEPGTGAAIEQGKFVKVNYAGFLTNGDLFDNSFQKGRPFPYQVGRGRVIKGWGEALPLLKEGGKGTFFIPYQLAYGEAGRPPSIPPKSELVFYIEVVENVN
ncbi:MAG: FKBP-type peptidyl-prolyl cis-trans isomerase, partial [Bacteroidota bacterium]